MTDVVYITGGKSMWQYNELRYSIRSLCKYLDNMGNVFIVGRKPDWLINVTFTPAEDFFLEKKEPRLYRKRLIACRDERISPTALFCYDDEYLLTEHDADNFPYYFNETIGAYYNRIPKEGHHKRCTANTIAALNEKGHTSLMYDIHVPMLFNRADFIKVMTEYNWNNKDGYLIKSTYANSINAGGLQVSDIKINHPDGTLNEYRTMINNRPWFSTGDNMNWPALGELMEELYPEKSPFEL